VTLLDERADDTLARTLTDADPAVRRQAAAALAATPEIALGGDGIRLLRQVAAEGQDAHTRRAARQALGALAERAATRYAAERAPLARVQAVLVLVALQAMPQLAKAGEDPVREVRIAVAAGLAKSRGNAAAIAALVRLLADRDPLVRHAALHAAEAVGVPAPLRAGVIDALTHPAWQVRKRAVLTLAAAGPETAVAPLRKALRDPDAEVRQAAIQSLERWAKPPKTAGPTLRGRAQHHLDDLAAQVERGSGDIAERPEALS
jgi:HEAT repeat protein